MRYITLSLIVLGICILSVAGCTTSGSDTYASPTPDAVSIDPTPALTAPPSSAPMSPVTVVQAPQKREAPTEKPVPTVLETVIFDEGTVVYSGTYKFFAFEDILPDDGFLYPDDRFRIEIASEEPVNVLFFKDKNIPIFMSEPIYWNTIENEWKYPSGIEPLAQYEEVIRKTFNVEVLSIGKYSLCLDGRIAENDLTIANDAFSVDVKITKIETC